MAPSSDGEQRPVRPGEHHLDGPTRLLVLLGLGVAATLDVAYWVLWVVARDVVAGGSGEAYTAFEQAFPLADAWLLVLVLGGFVAVLRRRPSALFWLLVGGGAGVYLGCMDLLYDLEHAVFGSGPGGLVELGIVVATFVLSISMLRWSWRRRRTMLDI